MEIGFIKWFGGYNNYRNLENNYGFISMIDSNTDVFFHRNAIKKGSRLGYHPYEGALVAFECVTDKKLGKKKAQEVQFLNEIPVEKIPELFSEELLYNREIKRYFISLIPEFYLGSNAKEYFDYFEIKAVRELFRKRNKEHYFGQSVYKTLSDYLTGPTYHRWKEEYWDIFDFGQASDNEVYQLMLAGIRCGIGKLCAERHEVWEKHSEIIAMFSKDLIESMVKHGWKCKKSLLDYLLNNITSSETKAYLCSGLSIDDVFEHPVCISFIDDAVLAKLVKEIQWNNLDSNYVSKVRIIIESIEADIQEKTAVAIAEGLLESATSLFMWWKYINDSVKVRVLIYFSNFSRRKKEWFNVIREVYQFEYSSNNELLLAVLQYFKIIYYGPDDYYGKQQCFMEAHNKLMQYITNCYSRGVDITSALNTLLVKCYNHQPKDTYYFCDAKKWNKENGVFCPEGISRTYSRRKCEYFKSTDMLQTKFVKEKSYESQNLADFVRNLNFKPDLTSINIKDFDEYAYRISAFVNRLIDMRPHMRCKCGALFHADFKYSKLVTAKLSATIFDCPNYSPNNPENHDARVYLNYCCRCHEVIDSRECKIQDAEHYYICMKCGGTEIVVPGTQCPNCGTTDKNFLEYSGNRITCRKCGHQAR